MKTVGKMEDAPFDKLLRAGLRRSAAGGVSCAGFDPDLANAYIEHVLMGEARSGYEQHLSYCAPCRSNVAVLARMAQAELHSPVQTVSSKEVRSNLFDGLKAAFALLATPRWAIAATAILVVAVSVPLLYSSKRAMAPKAVSEGASDVEGFVAGSATPRESGQQQAAELKAPVSVEVDRAGYPSPTARSGRAAEPTTRDAGQSVPIPPPSVVETAAGPVREAAAPSQQTRDDSRQQQVARGNEARGASDQAQTTAAGSASQAQTGTQRALQDKDQQSTGRLAQIDQKKSLSLPESSRDSAHVTALKPGVVGATEEKAKGEATATIKPDDAQAPKTDAGSEDGRARRAVASPSPKLSMRYRLEREAATSGGKLVERKIEGKRFVLIKEFWTDRRYDPDKEVPVVTVVRDSDVYRQLVTKVGGLRKLFAGFQESDRVIIVYKGTVYKLLPPEK
jgi:hypothetical protein